MAIPSFPRGCESINGINKTTKGHHELHIVTKLVLKDKLVCSASAKPLMIAPVKLGSVYSVVIG